MNQRIITGLIRFLNIQRNELKILNILTIQSVFLGVFAGALQISVQAHFLEVFDASYLPRVFAMSGGIGIILVSIYFYLRSKINFLSSSYVIFSFVLLMLVLLRIGLYLNNEHFSFALLAIMGPLIVLVFLIFRDTANHLFIRVQGKRLFNFLNSGQIFGLIFIAFLIPILLEWNFELLNALYISIISLLLVVFIQIYISRRNKAILRTQIEQKPIEKFASYYHLLRHKVTGFLVLFVILTGIASLAVHIVFLSLVEISYTETASIAKFLGIFLGVLMITTLFIKWITYGWIMKKYGLRITIFLSPVLIGILAIAALLVGKLFGYSASAAGFTLFFFLVVTIRLIVSALHDSLSSPSFRLIFQTIEKKYRIALQDFIDGSVNEIATLLGGLSLLLIIAAGLPEIISSVYFLALITVFWFVSAFLLYKSYRKALVNSMDQMVEKKDDDDRSSDLLSIENQTDNQQLKRILNYVPQAWDGFISRNMNKLIQDEDPELLDITLKWIDKLNLIDAYKLLSKYSSGNSISRKDLLGKLLNRFDLFEDDIGKEEISRMVASAEPDNRLAAISIIMRKSDVEAREYLANLIHDHHKSVRIAALRAAAGIKMIDKAPEIVEMINDDVYYPFVYKALAEMGPDIADTLDRSFHRFNEYKARLRILRLIAEVKAPNSAQYLLEKTEKADITMTLFILKGLKRLDVDFNEQQVSKLFEVLHQHAGVTAWNLAALASIRKFALDKDLELAMQIELDDNFEILYTILGLIYQDAIISSIRENLELGSAESIGYALELLKMTIDNEIQPILIPLMEDNSLLEKVNNLKAYFPVQIQKPNRLLSKIITRDGNLIDNYSRIMAMKACQRLKDYSPGNDLISQMFNPDSLVRRSAAVVLSESAPAFYQSILERLPEEYVQELKEFVGRMKKDETLRDADRIKLLESSTAFSGVNRQLLLKFLRYVDVRIYRENDQHIFQDILHENSLLYVAKGELNVGRLSEGYLELHQDNFAKAGDLLKMFIEDPVNILFKSDVIIFLIDEDRLKEFIFDYEKVFLPLINRIDNIDILHQKTEA